MIKWKRVSNIDDEGTCAKFAQVESLEELHKRAYESIDRFDNYNYDNDENKIEENEFSVFINISKGRE